jgi:hypothetical protein
MRGLFKHGQPGAPAEDQSALGNLVTPLGGSIATPSRFKSLQAASLGRFISLFDFGDHLTAAPPRMQERLPGDLPFPAGVVTSLCESLFRESIRLLCLVSLLLGVVRVNRHNDHAAKRKSKLRPIKPVTSVLRRTYNYVAVHWDWAGALALIGGLLMSLFGLGLFFLWKEGDTEGQMLLRVLAGVIGFCVPALWILPWAFERLDL